MHWSAVNYLNRQLCIQLEWRVPILAKVLDIRVNQNEHIKEQTCPSVTPSFMLTHSPALDSYVCIKYHKIN